MRHSRFKGWPLVHNENSRNIETSLRKYFCLNLTKCLFGTNYFPHAYIHSRLFYALSFSPIIALHNCAFRGCPTDFACLKNILYEYEIAYESCTISAAFSDTEKWRNCQCTNYRIAFIFVIAYYIQSTIKFWSTE